MAIHIAGDFALRRMRPDDAPGLLAVCSDPVVMRHVGDGTVLTSTQVENWIANSAGNYSRVGYGSFIVADPVDDRVIGWGGFVPPGREALPEIIYGLARNRWGRGIGRRLARALLDYGFREQGFARVLATVDAGNQASIRILEGAGMRHEATSLESGVPVRRYLLERGAWLTPRAQASA